MKTVRILIVITIIAGFIRLFFWVLPTLGIIRFEPTDPPFPENGASLVIYENGEPTGAISLSMVKNGWSGVREGWPLVVIGLMIGYPIGELARRKFAIDKASKEAIEISEKYANDAYTRERNADKMLKKAQALHTDMPRLQNELAEARKEIAVMNSCEEDLLRNYADLRRRKDSVEKELTKARAKIKRLSEKNNSRIGKTVDTSQLSE